MGESRYDSKRQILWMTMSAADVMGGGGMKGVSAIFIRDAQEVQLSGYCDEASYMFFCDVFEGIVCSAKQSERDRGVTALKVNEAIMIPNNKELKGNY
jgi:hypothetical protein